MIWKIWNSGEYLYMHNTIDNQFINGAKGSFELRKETLNGTIYGIYKDSNVDPLFIFDINDTVKYDNSPYTLEEFETFKETYTGFKTASGGSGAADLLAHINNLSNPHVVNKEQVGLSNVNNTSDIDKPVSTLQAIADTDTLNAAKSYSDSLVLGLVDDRGGYDASSNLFPSTGGSGITNSIIKGDQWEITASGILGGKTVDAGDLIRALSDTPAQIPTNWFISSYNTQQATDTVRGTVRLATSAETITGTDSSKVITPVSLQSKINNINTPATLWTPRDYIINSLVTHTDGKVYKANSAMTAGIVTFIIGAGVNEWSVVGSISEGVSPPLWTAGDWTTGDLCRNSGRIYVASSDMTSSTSSFVVGVGTNQWYPIDRRVSDAHIEALDYKKGTTITHTDSFQYKANSDIAANVSFVEGTSSNQWTKLLKLPTIQRFTSSGTYTPTLGMKYCIIEMVGGGGAGGGRDNTTSNEVSIGGAGASGGYIKFMATASQVGSSQSITVGSGGTGNIASVGTSGSNTVFGSLATASGGAGGTFQTATTSADSTGSSSGGTVTLNSGTLLISYTGQRGGSSSAINTGTIRSISAGAGGSNPLGVGGAASLSAGTGNISTVGLGGSGYGSGASGSGGAGSISLATGQQAQNGIVIVTEYFS